MRTTLFLLLTTCCYGGTLTYTTVAVPGTDVRLFGVNNSGQISGAVGDYGLYGTPAAYSAYLYSGPNTAFSFGGGINDLGVAAGTAGLTSDAYTYDGASFTQVLVGSFATWGNGVNRSGDVTGYYRILFQYHGFLKSGSTYSSFDAPGAYSTFATAINDGGAIAGYYYDATGEHGFLTLLGAYFPIDYPGAASTHVLGMNNSFAKVGIYGEPGDLVTHGFLQDGNGFTTIDIPGALSTYLTSISNNGTLAGYYFPGVGTNAIGFVGTWDPNATTAPEPSTYGFMASGVVLLGLYFRNRRTSSAAAPTRA